MTTFLLGCLTGATAVVVAIIVVAWLLRRRDERAQENAWLQHLAARHPELNR